jgi:D-glycero-alpha-D-manno-heptose-7-phosphate kinase
MNEIKKHIQSTAPVRICDVGGWTDTWFAGHGAVFNIGVTPNIEIGVTVANQEKDERVTLHLENYDETYCLEPGKIKYNRHPLIEASIDSMEIPQDMSLDIEIFSHVPAGASVGTSASLTVALIAALDALTPGHMTPYELADAAHRVETDKLGLQSGVQDQLCSAFGGINFIRIDAFPDSKVIPIKAAEEIRHELEQRLLLIYIGSPHHSSDVHKMVIADLGDEPERDPRLQRLRELAVDAKDAVRTGSFEILGEVMNRNTQVQRALHRDLVCDEFEELIEIADFYDASGCKVNGAGGDGGSMTVLCDGDPVKKKEFLHTLEEKSFRPIPISISSDGVRVWENGKAK